MKSVPCFKHEYTKITVCPDCYQDMVEDLQEHIAHLNDLKKVIDKLPHSHVCSVYMLTSTDCNCWKSKIEEIYNG